eukprot:EC716761.1.p1 GENE.EC716761.1~~EC716761.1.p1  ORF type:complete len:197 (+),score=7.12 EC716761.1:101-691(+)
MVLPLIKVGALFVKQAVKPVAAAIKEYAKNNPRFRGGSIAFAQWWHRMEVSIQVRMMGHEPRAIKQLEETKAVQVAADLLAEAFVFSVGMGVLLLEWRHSKAKEEAKAARIDATLASMRTELDIIQNNILAVMRASEYVLSTVLSHAPCGLSALMLGCCIVVRACVRVCVSACGFYARVVEGYACVPSLRLYTYTE